MNVESLTYWRLSTVYVDKRCSFCGELGLTFQLLARCRPPADERRGVPRAELERRHCSKCGFKQVVAAPDAETALTGRG